MWKRCAASVSAGPRRRHDCTASVQLSFCRKQRGIIKSDAQAFALNFRTLSSLPGAGKPASSRSSSSSGNSLLAAVAALAAGAGTASSVVGCREGEKYDVAEGTSHSQHMFPSTLDQSPPAQSEYVLSQGHLLQPTDYNPMPTMLPPPIAGLSGFHLRHRHVASVIGLPLRGKAHMARRLQRYLRFFHGAEVELFDVNSYLGPAGDDKLLEALRTFFEGQQSEESADGGDEESRERKHLHSGRFAILYTSDTSRSLSSMWSGHSKWQRRWMSQTLASELEAQAIFIEVAIDDSTHHRKDYMERLESSKGLLPGKLAAKVKDYQQHFVTIQQDGTEDDLEYMKLINYNHKVLTNNMMRSFLGSRIAQFLTSVHPYPRTIYLTRHGESEYNAAKKIGGDSPLSLLGREYAERLGQFAELVICKGAKNIAFVVLKPGDGEKLTQSLTRIPTVPIGEKVEGIYPKGDWSKFGVDSSASAIHPGMRLVRLQREGSSEFEEVPSTIEELVNIVGSGSGALVFVEDPPGGVRKEVCARLWTSSLKRTQETAEHIPHPSLQSDGKTWKQMSLRMYRNLDEVYAGEFEGLTYEEIKSREPKEASLRKIDKLGYRYPRGESYYDIIARLDNPMQQLETFQEPILLIAHQAVHRLIYAFLVGIPRENATEISIPLHTVIKIDLDGIGTIKETRYMLGPTELRSGKGQKLSEFGPSDGQKHL